ncbi:MAG: FAD-dependent oxidoreductase [Lachnospiraceae bacterium]|nr:FAD-dependent oxidoreductase [Lachnospiraceae bacterium]MCI1657347.1 FAD-dependent oxidoreductase [Lachnospiraceae bacterium]MCI2195825.1 FAD-dependent oxidoreductase [Lachnospiraceae bacterium]
MKNKYYPHLFEKGKIGNLTIKNRTIRNSMGTYLSNPVDCSVTPNNIKAAAEAADGGVGLVFMDNVLINDSYHMGLSAASDRMIPGLSLIADAIKEHGAAAGMQLSHPGRDGAFVGGDDCASASRITAESWFDMGMPAPREMSTEEVKQVIEQYGDAALRVKKAGFDLVEVMAAAGCLPCNFLSPKDNTRTDMYGGNLHNRMRFVIEVTRNIRRKCGPDFPLSFKLSVDDYEGGIHQEETIEVVKALEKEGVNLFNIVCGTHATTWTQTGFYPLGIYVPYAEAIKEAVNVSVLVTGNIQTPEQAEQILAEGKADFIGLARSQLADPYFVKKAREGRAEDIVPCIRCMIGCNDKGLLANTVIHCAVNPTLYKYECPPIVPAEKPKKVAVIGGGPGGLEAALTCKKRGHDVTLYEKRELGGLMIEAAAPSYKQDIWNLIEYYKTQLKKYDIPVIMEEASAETIKDGGYDAAIVAIGGKPRMVNVPGIDDEIVCHALDVIGGKPIDGDKAVVIGGGITGAETALELAEAGKKVTIVEMMDQFLGVFSAVVPAYLQAVHEAGIKVITGMRLERVEDHMAVIVDRFGNHKELPADGIVISAGFIPQTELADQLEEETEMEVFAVGDCKKARQIYDAIHEGFIAARCL